VATRDTVVQSLLFRLVTPLVAAAFAVVLTEVVVRGAYGWGNEVDPGMRVDGDLVQANFRALYEYDSRLGWVPLDHARGFKGVPISTGPDGLRSNGRAHDLSSMRGQVLALGDSFTFGDEVADNGTWPAHLEKRLEDRAPAASYQVLNGGVSSYGLDQMVLRAEALVPKYRPRIVIVSFIQAGFERLRQTTRHGVPKPYFVVADDGLELQNVPTPRPTALNRYHQILLARSALAQFAAQRAPRFVRNLLGAGTMAEHVRSGEPSATAIAGRLFERLTALQRAYDVELIILAHPTGAEDPLDDATRAILSSFGRTNDRARVVNAVEAIERYAASKPEEAARFFHEDWPRHHMSSAGNAFIAQTVLPAVLTLLDARADSF